MDSFSVSETLSPQDFLGLAVNGDAGQHRDPLVPAPCVWDSKPCEQNPAEPKVTFNKSSLHSGSVYTMLNFWMGNENTSSVSCLQM